ncbi:MAG: cytochrome C [Geovibrio sp.]|nr:cytochrome C [Geovibrio sp.]
MDIASAMEIINIAEKYVPAPTKPAVNFEHLAHAQKMACTECHSDPESGVLKFEVGEIKGMKNDFHDKLCIDCHTKQRVKKTCNTCHK